MLNIYTTDVIVLKEISLRILHERKDFIFLTEKTEKDCLFSETLWRVSFLLLSNRFKLNSIQKEKKFFLTKIYRVLYELTDGNSNRRMKPRCG